MQTLHLSWRLGRKNALRDATPRGSPRSWWWCSEEEVRGFYEALTAGYETARRATEILKERHDLATSVLVGQIRSAAVDILRSTGMDQASALRALEEAAGRASEIG